MSDPVYIKLFYDYLATFERLSDAQTGRLVKAWLLLANTGEEPDFPANTPEYFLWPQLRESFIRDCKAYQKTCSQNKENGKKGGRPRKDQEKQQENQGFAILDEDDPFS